MKTKTIVFSLVLTFAGSALFAQTDTTQKRDTIPTDSIPKKDTLGFNQALKQDFTVFNSSDAVKKNTVPFIISKNNSAILKEEVTSTL
jgi:hypothetical protein